MRGYEPILFLEIVIVTGKNTSVCKTLSTCSFFNAAKFHFATHWQSVFHLPTNELQCGIMIGYGLCQFVKSWYTEKKNH